MKTITDLLSTQIRHIITFAAGALTLLTEKGLLTADEAGAASSRIEGFSDFISPLIAVILVRLILQLLGMLDLGKFSKFLKSIGKGENGAAVVMIALLSTALGAGCLVSCSSSAKERLANIPLQGRIYYQDRESGAKGGLVFERDKTPKGYARYPLRDPDTGEITGWADVEVGGREIHDAK